MGGTEEQRHGTQRAEAGPEEGPKGRDGTQRLYRVLDKERRRRGAERTGGAQAEAKPRGQGPLLTFLAGGRRSAPGQVPLASENVGAEQLVSRLALVSKHRASD